MGHSRLHFIDHFSHTPPIYHTSHRRSFLGLGSLGMSQTGTSHFRSRAALCSSRTSACFSTSTHSLPYRGTKQTSNLETTAFLKAVSATVQIKISQVPVQGWQKSPPPRAFRLSHQMLRVQPDQGLQLLLLPRSPSALSLRDVWFP